MSRSRREFLNAATAVSASLALSAAHRSLAAEPVLEPAQQAAKPLRILILGGTGFIGPHQVRYALARGHKLTLFNRGRTNPGLFPNVELLEGDRNGSRMSNQRAVAKGLTFRPLADTARATLEDYQTRLAATPALKLQAGLTPQRETDALTAWHTHKKTA